ncbi:hypothetical protein B0O95_102320 [Mycetohabitans endofungorum]|uniref:Uncharacterized protein n=1 Tax=Mycetohabitans endofungorum TaxID=417203 RepID=A0A2P5KDX9_9BURK|nr:hypothetical protein B0O95_102320 [Mycetohabitans endofungorum]
MACTIVTGKYARGDARWRPFNGPLSAASQRQARVILNGLFTWLVNAGYLRGNPMALLRQRAKRSAPRMKRTNRLHGLPRIRTLPPAALKWRYMPCRTIKPVALRQLPA